MKKREGLKGDALQESFNFRPISEVFKSTKSKSLLIDRGSSNDSPILINYFEPKVARKLVLSPRWKKPTLRETQR